MYLFFDGVSSRGYIWLYDASRDCVASQYFDILWNESLKSLWVIASFLQDNNLSYENINHIACVTWPWSFTWVRCITLIINTLAFTYSHIRLTPVNWFDMSDTYPLVKSSSKRDLFVKREKWAIIEIVANEDIETVLWTWKVYGDTQSERFSHQNFYPTSINYPTIFKNLVLQDAKKLSPLYCKKPNIS